jgi:hypothetical protein
MFLWKRRQRSGITQAVCHHTTRNNISLDGRQDFAAAGPISAANPFKCVQSKRRRRAGTAYIYLSWYSGCQSQRNNIHPIHCSTSIHTEQKSTAGAWLTDEKKYFGSKYIAIRTGTQKAFFGYISRREKLMRHTRSRIYCAVSRQSSKVAIDAHSSAAWLSRLYH